MSLELWEDPYVNPYLKSFIRSVDGGYSEWQEWSECSLTCGGGTRHRRRLCDNPVPIQGGRMCDGADDNGVEVVSEDCNVEPCPGVQNEKSRTSSSDGIFSCDYCAKNMHYTCIYDM